MMRTTRKRFVLGYRHWRHSVPLVLILFYGLFAGLLLLAPGARSAEPDQDTQVSALGRTNSGHASAHLAATRWYSETVASGGAYGPTSLALGSDGYPHISYFGPGKLMYTPQNILGWHPETATNTSGLSGQNSLALDEDGYPHISYFDGALGYVYKDASGWHNSTVDTHNQAGWQNSLRLDAQGWPHIAYSSRGDDSYDDLMYAYRDVDGWHVETVENGRPDEQQGWGASLALDGAGYPHISHHTAYRKWKYAYKNALGWQYETVHDKCYWGSSTSLALDMSDLPHMVCDCSGEGVEYAHPTAIGWDIEIVDSNDGGGVSLLLDRDGFPHISYHSDGDVMNRKLKHAYRDPLGWHVETVDGPGNVGSTSLAQDDDGHSHISYYYSVNAAVRYATTKCTPLDGVLVAGPPCLVSKAAGAYTAVYTPPIASLPIIVTWDNGMVGPTTEYSWTVPGTYTCGVTATNPCGQGSERFAVEVVPPPPGPVLPSPANGSSTCDRRPAFAWSPVTGATSYRIQVDDDPDFSSLTIDATTSDASYTPTLPLLVGAYSWHVRAANECGPGEWSAVWDLEISRCLYLPLILREQ